MSLCRSTGRFGRSLAATGTALALALIATPTWAARLWRGLVKPPYRFVTRVVLRWPERAGPAERQD